MTFRHGVGSTWAKRFVPERCWKGRLVLCNLSLILRRCSDAQNWRVVRQDGDAKRVVHSHESDGIFAKTETFALEASTTKYCQWRYQAYLHLILRLNRPKWLPIFCDGRCTLTNQQSNDKNCCWAYMTSAISRSVYRFETSNKPCGTDVSLRETVQMQWVGMSTCPNEHYIVKSSFPRFPTHGSRIKITEATNRSTRQKTDFAAGLIKAYRADEV